jgi:hypothetical protein
MNYPPEAMVRDFPLRDALAARPDLCRLAGFALIAFEFALAALLWCRPLRRPAVIAGIAFHALLHAMLHIPSVFFLVMTGNLLLFWPGDGPTARKEGQGKTTNAGEKKILARCGL